MVEGVIHHCTEMEVDRQYVDSHGQSMVAFAFCRLLGFQLLPRLKAIHSQKLYRPEIGKAGCVCEPATDPKQADRLGAGAATVRPDDQAHQE
jgi:TnpA family transposase